MSKRTKKAATPMAIKAWAVVREGGVINPFWTTSALWQARVWCRRRGAGVSIIPVEIRPLRKAVRRG